MPYKLTKVTSERVLSHENIDIYHIYKNDDTDNDVSVFWYTTDIYGVKNGVATFDIRDIYSKLQVECPDMVLDPNETHNHEQIIRYAIDLHIIKQLCDQE